MSRRTAIVEEFDDDTDLPLPSQPLPNTGTRGPLLEEIGSGTGSSASAYDFDMEEEPASTSTSASRQAPTQPSAQPSDPALQNTVRDLTPYKKWSCIYPIYIDAKRPYGTGQRRIARAKSVWYPLSKDIADATSRLGLRSLHEVNKAHPRDWENPGRVRVQWKMDGRLVNQGIKTKKELLEMISLVIQRTKPDLIPKAPYHTASPKPSTPTTTITTPKSKPKHPPPPSKTQSKPPHAQEDRNQNRRLPIPPDPHPPLASRVSAYSPALPSGILVETVKAGMNVNANDGGAGAGGAAGGAGGAGAGQKGKRKVVRVRG
ncbi:hypothetical protein PLICRDRAFT_105853 [Plicaturopsis crispa FD-325 SS-3]|nr:hypothetical protein PLICRDRAFT_105853 [Plicaturopsis crispa FD-325 SS-3]